MWIEYKKCKAIFKHTLLKAKKQSWEVFVSSINSQTPTSKVWKKTKALRTPQTQAKILLKNQGNIIHKSEEVAELLAVDFTCRGKSTATIDINIQGSKGNNSEWYNADFKLRELDRAMSSCHSKSPGPDKIPYELIKQCSKDQKIKILKIFNHFWKNRLPQQWKQSITIPLYKTGKPRQEASSYRPIALTNCLAKLFERMVTLRLKKFLEDKRIFTQQQNGFRSGRCTTDSICKLEFDVRNGFIKGHSTLAVFLDITQAFDSVSHNILLKKLADLGIQGNLLNFIRDFISDRQTSVRVHCALSSKHGMSCGVPQGCVISPILFLIMINDIFKDAEEKISFSIFADDCAFWITDKCKYLCHEIIQKQLDKTYIWTTENELVLSTNKTKAMYFSYSNLKPPLLKMNGLIIDYVPDYKYLGMILDRTLIWKKHIMNLKNKCVNDLRLMKIISYQGWGADGKSLHRLYSALILPKISYGAFFYDTAAKTNLMVVNRIQF